MTGMATASRTASNDLVLLRKQSVSRDDVSISLPPVGLSLLYDNRYIREEPEAIVTFSRLSTGHGCQRVSPAEQIPPELGSVTSGEHLTRRIDYGKAAAHVVT
jgi:hypothetical protein